MRQGKKKEAEHEKSSKLVGRNRANEKSTDLTWGLIGPGSCLDDIK